MKNGILKEKENLDSAIQSLEKSLQSYEKAMILDEQDEDAKLNHDFVKKRA